MDLAGIAEGRVMGQALEVSMEPQAVLERAKALVVEAMAELDRCGAPADIAAHLDFAVHRIDHAMINS
jgi:hypothetical protein